MGYLNNQIITVDAILTKKGRELLAKNDGSFRITQFALSDDEIDYTLYNPTNPSGSAYYGQAIEGMPLLEAFSDEDLKSVYDHRLVLLLRKAALFDQMVSKRQGIKPVVNNGPRPAKPGAAGRVSTTSEATRAQQRLAKT